MILDLTQILTDNMQVYPGDKSPSLTRQKDISADKYTDYQLITGMHAGTHIDGPMHLTPDNRFISSLPLTSFTGTGCIFDVHDESIIKWKDSYTPKLKGKEIVIVNTGFHSYFGTEKYIKDNPVVDESFANALIENKIKMLGIDLMSPDARPHLIHKMLLSAGILIAENLTGLDRLKEIGDFEVIALPLKIMADSSPARIIAREICR